MILLTLNVFALRAAALMGLLVLSAGAWAQIVTPPDGQWRGTGGAALSATSGNTDTAVLGLQADLARATPDNRLALLTSANYGRNRAQGVRNTTASKWALAGQYDHNQLPPLYAFTRLGFEGDEVIALALRSTVAAGVGYKVLQGQPTTLNLFVGGAYSSDRYRREQTVDGVAGRRFSRVSFYLGQESVHTLTANTIFKQRLELYPGWSGDRAVLARFNAALLVAMTSSLSVSLSFVNSYNSNPPAGNRRNDAALLVGINAQFGPQ
ncbi:MAG: DUF481 domain-containing protein [Rubrivivax sp.]|nr:DUF481 domain-containing protein [Rubrivivax sp.]